MSNEHKILDLFRAKKYITTKEVENVGISRRFLGFLVAKNKIIRLSRGIYTLPNELEDDYFIIGNMW